MAEKRLAGAALKSHQEGSSPAPPAPKGNTRSLRHGLRSERTLAPRREEHMEALRRDYPELDERRLALLADRLARIDLASAWLDEQKGLVRNRQGEVFGVVRDLEKWAGRAEQVLAQAANERRSPRRVDLAASMSALDEGDGG